MKKILSNINKTSFWICLALSVGLIVTSFILPPQGLIDPSVLTAVGEIFAFATLGTIIQGIERGADIKIKHNNTEVEVDNPDQ